MAKKKSFRGNSVSNVSNIFLSIIIGIFSLLCVVPLVLVAIVSITDESALNKNGYSFFPEKLSLYAYEFLYKLGDQIVHSYLVSITVTLFGTLLSLFVMILFAYAVSRSSFPFRKPFLFIVFFTMLFNGGMVPSYIVTSSVLKLSNTIFALIFPYTVNAFYIIILKTFFTTTVPESVIESAKIDGAGEMRTLFQIVLPISKPAIATVGLFTLVGYWNDWWLGLLYITKPKLTSIQYLLMQVQSQLDFLRQNSMFASNPQASEMLKNQPSESARMAMVMIVTIPILFAYPFFQRYFVSGLTVGAVKG